MLFGFGGDFVEGFFGYVWIMFEEYFVDFVIVVEVVYVVDEVDYCVDVDVLCM